MSLEFFFLFAALLVPLLFFLFVPPSSSLAFSNVGWWSTNSNQPTSWALSNETKGQSACEPICIRNRRPETTTVTTTTTTTTTTATTTTTTTTTTPAAAGINYDKFERKYQLSAQANPIVTFCFFFKSLEAVVESGKLRLWTVFIRWEAPNQFGIAKVNQENYSIPIREENLQNSKRPNWGGHFYSVESL